MRADTASKIAETILNIVFFLLLLDMTMRALGVSIWQLPKLITLPSIQILKVKYRWLWMLCYYMFLIVAWVDFAVSTAMRELRDSYVCAISFLEMTLSFIVFLFLDVYTALVFTFISAVAFFVSFIKITKRSAIRQLEE